MSKLISIIALGILGDKLNYLPQNQEQRNYPPTQHNQEPIYERRADLYGRLPFGTRLGGEIRQVIKGRKMPHITHIA